MGFMFRSLFRWFGYVKRRRWLRRLLYCLIFVPLGLFLCSNIFLNSRWLKGKVEKRLETKTGISWEIGTLNWTPNGVVHVYNAKARLGEGELSIDQIDIKPIISDGISGDLRFREVVVDKPRLELELNWLRNELEKRVPVEVPKVKPKSKPLVAVHKPKPITPNSGKVVESVKPIEKKEEAEVKEDLVSPKVVLERDFPRWLRVNGAEVVLKDRGSILLEVNGVDVDLPLSGEGEKGEVSLKSVSVLNKKLLGKEKVSFDRVGGDFAFDDIGCIMGVSYYFSMRVKLIGRNAYFLAKTKVMEQDVLLEEKVEGVGFAFGAEGLRGEGLVKGDLAKPSSWKGVATCFADRVHLVEHHREGSVDMNLKFLGKLERGFFWVPEFRMWSENISVLGNGYARMNGKVTGVTRVIGSRDAVGWITEVQHGVELFQGERYSLVSQWDNPDRYYVDFKIDGPVQELEWKAEGVSDWEKFWPAVGKMKQFIREERLEDEAP